MHTLTAEDYGNNLVTDDATDAVESMLAAIDDRLRAYGINPWSLPSEVVWTGLSLAFDDASEVTDEVVVRDYILPQLQEARDA